MTDHHATFVSLDEGSFGKSLREATAQELIQNPPVITSNLL
jgi:hypothetical protein